MMPVTFFAIEKSRQNSVESGLLDLPILEFNRGIPAENVHCDLELAPLGLNLFDHAAEIQERSIVNLDRFAHLELDLRALGVLRVRHLRLDMPNFVRRDRHGPLAADEADDAGGFADEIP